MKTPINKETCLREFHQEFGLPAWFTPRVPPSDRRKLRVDLINEEAKEFQESSEAGDLVNAAKELADILYVVYGAAVEWGIPLDAVFEKVHRSNMGKVWPDGKVHYNEAGKVLKPPTYTPPDIASVLREWEAGI